MNLFVFNQIQQRPLVVLYGAPTLYGSQCGSVHKNIIPFCIPSADGIIS